MCTLTGELCVCVGVCAAEVCVAQVCVCSSGVCAAEPAARLHPRAESVRSCVCVYPPKGTCLLRHFFVVRLLFFCLLFLLVRSLLCFALLLAFYVCLYLRSLLSICLIALLAVIAFLCFFFGGGLPCFLLLALAHCCASLGTAVEPIHACCCRLCAPAPLCE